MGKRGPKPKDESERALRKMISFPPDLWDEFEELVPDGQRSGFIHRLLRPALRRLRKKQAERGATDVPG